jgi:hypothetical protein
VERQQHGVWYTTTTSASVDLGGDTVGFHVRGEMELTLTPQWQLDAGLGYRWAQAISRSPAMTRASISTGRD